jgi:hypothetical protein
MFRTPGIYICIYIKAVTVLYFVQLGSAIANAQAQVIGVSATGAGRARPIRESGGHSGANESLLNQSLIAGGRLSSQEEAVLRLRPTTCRGTPTAVNEGVPPFSLAVMGSVAFSVLLQIIFTAALFSSEKLALRAASSLLGVIMMVVCGGYASCVVAGVGHFL